MDYLKQLFEIGVQDWVDFVIKSLILIGISAVILWIFYFIIVKIFGKKTKLHRDFFLSLQFLWALFIQFLIINVYWFYVVKNSGLHKFNWTSLKFYLDIGPQIIIYLIITLTFIVSYKKYKSLIKN